MGQDQRSCNKGGINLRERTTPLFHRGHYNVLAKLIRAELSGAIAARDVAHTTHITELAITFAKWFKHEREGMENTYDFDPLRFLDACSPDPDMYPLSELWESDE